MTTTLNKLGPRPAEPKFRRASGKSYICPDKVGDFGLQRSPTNHAASVMSQAEYSCDSWCGCRRKAAQWFGHRINSTKVASSNHPAATYFHFCVVQAVRAYKSFVFCSSFIRLKTGLFRDHREATTYRRLCDERETKRHWSYLPLVF